MRMITQDTAKVTLPQLTNCRGIGMNYHTITNYSSTGSRKIGYSFDLDYAELTPIIFLGGCTINSLIFTVDNLYWLYFPR